MQRSSAEDTVLVLDGVVFPGGLRLFAVPLSAVPLGFEGSHVSLRFPALRIASGRLCLTSTGIPPTDTSYFTSNSNLLCAAETVGCWAKSCIHHVEALKIKQECPWA